MSQPTTAHSQEPNPENIGFVLYTETRNPGVLIARWKYGKQYFGSGIATGGPLEGFKGNYHVRYFLEGGEFSNEYDLEILQAETFYDLIWRVDNVIKIRGVGMLVDNGTGLAVGWQMVDG